METFGIRYKLKGKGNKLFRDCLNIDNLGNLDNDFKLLDMKIKKFHGDGAKIFDFYNLDDDTIRKVIYNKNGTTSIKMLDI